ncbi:NADP-dependent 3-hydroxy acid dehydrogenase YdfG [Panacagrimonas perspica]|uniref:NADP-dependent 3-hydroxy acid dehydrogenase YdfG n=1 Tax=Panacagrimonas perspica TaxID=381431 RepID=A0A4S3JYI2_9GAMM|nr:SDR family oxidoreductase [Panacagrimonas perspica]TDU32223.1 NADP-dependent 3-hydroxy acid dehydrogenase YdfG [Panacagrimonas perspica]THD00586.1 3-oxoacyl-ACP reductase [Panacagrimonas perspica]
MTSSSRIALVTGAGSGIGRAVALRLAASGYRVVLCGRRKSLLDAVAHEAGAACSLVVEADVADATAVTKLFGRIESECGRLDLLFNNAGISGTPGPVEELAAEDFQRVLATNVTGAFLCAQAAFRMMKNQRPQGGRIVNNGSVSAQTPRPHMTAYTVSKHAITGLTKSLALEGRAHAIACGQIDIGNTVTELLGKLGREALQADGSRRAEPSFDVTHVADAVLYMAQLPLDANVLSMTVAATGMPLVGRG